MVDRKINDIMSSDLCNRIPFSLYKRDPASNIDENKQRTVY